MLYKKDFSYTLPKELIAQTPLVQRDASRLLILDRHTCQIRHSNFRVLPSFLRKGDILVRNNSKVLKARIFGYKLPTGGKVEILLNKLIKSSTDSCIWECIVSPGIQEGQLLRFGADSLVAQCVGVSATRYTRQIEFRVRLSDFYVLLETIGETPLPPYIDPHKGATQTTAAAAQPLSSRYQTTYAKNFGSVAAPTAGLHFTPQLDDQLRSHGVEIYEVTLHVGLGTFLPVKTEKITEHIMHAEQFTLSTETAAALTTAKNQGRRIIAVGTTTCRVLESCAKLENLENQSPNQNIPQPTAKFVLQAQTAETDIFIYPPYRFKFIDGLITNFHLPESTLLMLISAFVCAPNTPYPFTSFHESAVGKAYAAAIKEQYRFFSFGDAVFIS